MPDHPEALRQALAALEYHQEQTRPIQRTIDTIASIKAALAEKPAAEFTREQAVELARKHCGLTIDPMSALVDTILAAHTLGRESAAAGVVPVAALTEARAIAAKQAEDDGLWFLAETASEAYLQQALRRLTAAVEGIGTQGEKT